MKHILFILLLLLPILSLYPQGIGQIVPEKEPLVFPDNSLGFDIMFGEGGFGLGGFYRRQLSRNVSFFTDISMSESKDTEEVEYIDFWGNVFVPGKKNRVYLIPLNAGLQYRVFQDAIFENLRPYFNIGAGPSMVVTTPYEKEFFSSFGKAKAHFTIGGYIGFGANFGINKSSLLGINLRYYVIHFFDEGVESLRGIKQKTLGGFYLTINIGMMY